jgi:hypothetical protein
MEDFDENIVSPSYQQSQSLPRTIYNEIITEMGKGQSKMGQIVTSVPQLITVNR